MIKLFDNGAYLLHGTELVEDNAEAGAVLASKLGSAPSKEEASKNTLAYGILAKHNTSDNMENLKIKFDKMTSHDITFVGIIPSEIQGIAGLTSSIVEVAKSTETAAISKQ